MLAPAAFLASRRTDRCPVIGIYPVGTGGTAAQLADAVGVMGRLVIDVVDGADPGVRAVLLDGPRVVTGAGRLRGASRAGAILHEHDVCAGLDVDVGPDAGLCAGAVSTAEWPDRTTEWGGLGRSDDPWGEQLTASRRAR